MVLEVELQKEIDIMLEETRKELEELREYNAKNSPQLRVQKSGLSQVIAKLKLPHINLSRFDIVPRLKRMTRNVYSITSHYLGKLLQSVSKHDCCRTNARNGDNICGKCGRRFSGDFVF